MEDSSLVLIAEDNPEDVILLRKALEKAGIRATVRFVSDGEQMILYLEGRGAYANREANPLPEMIILDLKMPRKSGFEVLEWLSSHRELSIVPTVVLSASNLDQDVRKAYDLGANTYFSKPGTFDELIETMRLLRNYWEKAEKLVPRLGQVSAPETVRAATRAA